MDTASKVSMSTPVVTPVRRWSAFRTIFIVLLFGLIVGAAAVILFVRNATKGFWNEVAAGLTRRSLSVDTSLPTVVSKIQKLQRLETVVYNMDKIVEGTRENAYLPDFLTGDKVVLMVHGETIAGIDLGKLQASDVKVDGSTVHVHLPQPEIFTTTLDNSKTRVFSRDTGLFVAADPNLESQVRAKAQEDLQQLAISSGILDTARKNAAATVTTMLLGLGFEQVQVD